MKLPPYPLTALRRHRERLQDRSREALAARLAELAEEEAELDSRRRILVALQMAQERARSETFATASQSLFQVGPVNRFHEAVEALGRRVEQQQRDIEAQEGVVAAARERIDAARRELAEATRSLEAVNRHRDRWVQQLHLAHQRREETLRSEVATSNWLRRNHVERIAS